MVGLCKYVYAVVETVDTVFWNLVVERRDPYSKLPINAGQKKGAREASYGLLGLLFSCSCRQGCCSLAVVDRILTSPSSG